MEEGLIEFGRPFDIAVRDPAPPDIIVLGGHQDRRVPQLGESRDHGVETKSRIGFAFGIARLRTGRGAAQRQEGFEPGSIEILGGGQAAQYGPGGFDSRFELRIADDLVLEKSLSERTPQYGGKIERPGQMTVRDGGHDECSGDRCVRDDPGTQECADRRKLPRALGHGMEVDRPAITIADGGLERSIDAFAPEGSDAGFLFQGQKLTERDILPLAGKDPPDGVQAVDRRQDLSSLGQVGQGQGQDGLARRLAGIHGISRSRTAAGSRDEVEFEARKPDGRAEIAGQDLIRVMAAGRELAEIDHPLSTEKLDHLQFLGLEDLAIDCLESRIRRPGVLNRLPGQQASG